MARFGPEVRHPVESRDLSLPSPGGELRLRVSTPPSPSGPALVFFHGGGWVSGSVETHDVFCRALAGDLGAVVISVDYRLAPEHPFPAGLDDAWLAARTIAAGPARVGAGTDGMVVGGDSAGGALAAVVARRARDEALDVRGQLLIYPVLDVPSDRESYRRYGQGCGLTRAGMELYWRSYVGPEWHEPDPDAAPLRCPDLRGLSPAVVVTAECDVLCDEGVEYAGRLRAAGVEVRERCYPGLVHGFLRIAGEVPVAAAAFHDLVGLTAAAFGYGVRTSVAWPGDLG